MSEPQNPYGQDPYRQYPVQGQEPTPLQQGWANPQSQPQQLGWAKPQPQPWGQVPPEPPQGSWPVTYQQPRGLVPTQPPPAKSTAKTVVGWILAVIAVLTVLSMMSRAGQGKLQLVSSDPAYTFGTWIGILLTLVLPAWGGYRLLTSHRRAMEKWQREQGQLPPR